MHPSVIIPKICVGETLHDLAITNFIADMIARMEDSRPEFNAANFCLYKEWGNLMVGVRTAEYEVTRCLEGYNYAYQVKQVMDAVTEAGFFKTGVLANV
ncbi:MAG: hypothetical protein HUK12_00325 [Muribaculaceae bacterium]|nr:hypothetical protein [Muribaculaceae bacterium]